MYLGLRDNVEAQFLIHETRSGLGEVTLVGHNAAPPKAARAACLVEPLGPLWIQVAVRFLVLGLEHSNVHLHNVSHKCVFVHAKVYACVLALTH